MHRAHPAISHCSHLLLKMYSAYKHKSLLKVHSVWLKNHISAKKVIFDQLFLLLFLHILLLCHILNSLNAVFPKTIRVSNCLDPDQVRHFVGPDLGPNSLQRLSADDLSCGKRTKSSIQNNFLILLSV